MVISTVGSDLEVGIPAGLSDFQSRGEWEEVPPCQPLDPRLTNSRCAVHQGYRVPNAHRLPSLCTVQRARLKPNTRIIGSITRIFQCCTASADCLVSDGVESGAVEEGRRQETVPEFEVDFIR